MPPPSRADLLATPADRAACRQAIRQGSRSFHLAGMLLPAAVREPAFAIYAFCRMADDMVDLDGGGTAAIDALSRSLDRIYAGRPRAHFVERAFAETVRDFAIPRAVPEALVEGLAWDAAGRRPETLSDLRAYAVRVAGTVGVMMSLVMRRRDPKVLARACDLGIAMQFTNICRDVGEDARNGRLYLPRELLDAAGIGADDVLAARSASPAIRRVVGRMLAEAESHYTLAASGIAALPAGSRPGIHAARLLYREIGNRIRDGVDPVVERAVVPTSRKLALVVAAAALPARRPDAVAAPCPTEAFDLLAAISGAPSRPRPATPQWWDVRGRAVRMVEMLAGFEASAARPHRDAGSGLGTDSGP